MTIRLLLAATAAVALFAADPAVARGRANVCHRLTEGQVAALFDRWNESLTTLDPKKVVANYAERSTLLPTVENGPYTTAAQKEGYFKHFLENHPTGLVTERMIFTDCQSAVDAGLYTFKYGDGTIVNARFTFTYSYSGGRWLITSHHSSKLPKPTE